MKASDEAPFNRWPLAFLYLKGGRLEIDFVTLYGELTLALITANLSLTGYGFGCHITTPSTQRKPERETVE